MINKCLKKVVIYLYFSCAVILLGQGGFLDEVYAASIKRQASVKVIVKGNYAISDEDIQYYLGINGSKITKKIVNNALRNLYKTGFFENVDIKILISI